MPAPPPSTGAAVSFRGAAGGIVSPSSPPPTPPPHTFAVVGNTGSATHGHEAVQHLHLRVYTNGDLLMQQPVTVAIPLVPEVFGTAASGSVMPSAAVTPSHGAADFGPSSGVSRGGAHQVPHLSLNTGDAATTATTGSDGLVDSETQQQQQQHAAHLQQQQLQQRMKQHARGDDDEDQSKKLSPRSVARRMNLSVTDVVRFVRSCADRAKNLEFGYSPTDVPPASAQFPALGKSPYFYAAGDDGVSPQRRHLQELAQHAADADGSLPADAAQSSRQRDPSAFLEEIGREFRFRELFPPSDSSAKVGGPGGRGSGFTRKINASRAPSESSKHRRGNQQMNGGGSIQQQRVVLVDGVERTVSHEHLHAFFTTVVSLGNTANLFSADGVAIRSILQLKDGAMVIATSDSFVLPRVCTTIDAMARAPPLPTASLSQSAGSNSKRLFAAPRQQAAPPPPSAKGNREANTRDVKPASRRAAKPVATDTTLPWYYTSHQAPATTHDQPSHHGVNAFDECDGGGRSTSRSQSRHLPPPPQHDDDVDVDSDDRALHQRTSKNRVPPPPPPVTATFAAAPGRRVMAPPALDTSSSSSDGNDTEERDESGDGRDPTVSRLEAVIAAARAKRFLWEKAPQGTTVPMPNDDNDARYGGQSRTVSNAQPQSRGMSPDRDIVFAPVAHHAGIQQPPVAVAAVAAGVAGVAGRSSPARQSKSSAQQSTTQDEPSTVTSATDAPRSGSKPKAKSGDTVNVASPTTQDGDTAPRDSKKHGSRRAASRSPKVSTRRQQQSKTSSALPTPKAPVGGDSEGNVGGGEATNSHEHERASPASDKTASNRPFVPLQPTMEEIRHLRGGLSKDSNGSGFSGLQRSWQSPTCEDDGADNTESHFARASPMAAGDNASRDSGGVGAGGGGKNRPPSLGDDFGSFTNTATPLGTTARTADSGMHRSTSRPLSVEEVGSPASTPHVTPPSRLRSPQYGKKKDATGKKSPSNFDAAPEPSESRERKAKKSKKSKKDGTARPVSPLPAHHLNASLEVDFGGSGSDNGGHRPRYISPIQRRRGESFKSPTLEDGSGSSGCPPPPPPQADTTLSNDDERSGASDSSGDAEAHATSSDEASDNDRRRAAPARNVAAVPLPEALRGAFAALGLDDTSESLGLSHPRDRATDDSPSTTPPSGQNVRGTADTDSPGSLSAAQRERMLRRRSTPSFTYHGDPNDSRRFHPYADDEELRDDATHTHTFPTDEQRGGGRSGGGRDPRHSPQRLDGQERDEQNAASVYSGHVKERSPAAGPQRYDDDDDDDDDRSLDAGLMPSDFERSHDGPSQLSSPAAQHREHLAAKGHIDDHRANSRSGHRHTPTSATRHRQNAATISPPRETSVDDTEDRADHDRSGARHGGDPAKQSIDVTETGGVDERRSSALGGFVDLVGNSADSSCSSLSKEGAEGPMSTDNIGGRQQKQRGEGEKRHGSSPRRVQASREMSPSASRSRRPLPPPPVESESSQPPSPERGTTHTTHDHRSLERDAALVGQVSHESEKKQQRDMAKQNDMTTPGGHHLSHSARLLPPEKLDMEDDDDVQASGEDPTRGQSAVDQAESNQHRAHSSADENRDVKRSEIDGSPSPSPARWKSNGQPRLQSPSSRDSPPQWGRRRDAPSSSRGHRHHRRHGNDMSNGDCGSDSADYEEEEEDEVQKLRPIDTLPPFPAVAECGPIEFLELTARAVDDAIATAAVRSKQNKNQGGGDTSKNASRRQGQNNDDDEPTIAAPSAAAAFVRTWAQLVSGQGIPVDVVLEHAARHPFYPPDPMPPGGVYPLNGADGISQPIGQSNRRNSDGQVDDVVGGASVRRAAPMSDPLQPTAGDDLAELDDDHANAAIDISRDSGTRAAVQIGLQAATTKTKAAASNGAQSVKAEPDAATAASLHDESDEEIVRVNESVEGGGVEAPRALEERGGDVDATATLNVSAIHGLSSDDHLSATPARPEASETNRHAVRSNVTQQVQVVAPVQKEAPRTAAQKSASGRAPGYHSGVVEDHPPPLLNLLFVDDIRRHCRAAFDHYSHHMHKQEWAHQADRTTVVLEPTHVSATNMPSMSNHEGAMSLGLSPQTTAVAPTPNASNQSTVPNVETTLAGSGKGSLKLWFTGPAGSGTTTALAILAAQSLLPQLAGDTAAARGLLTLPLNFEEVLLGAAGISGQTTATPTHPDHVPNKDASSDFGFRQKKKGGARASSSSPHRREKQRREGGETKAPTADVAVLFCRIMQVYVEALLGHRPEFAPVASSLGQFWKACVTQRSIPTIDITTSHHPAASAALLGRPTKHAAHARHTPASGLPSVPSEIQAALPLWRLVAMKVQRSYSRGDFVGVLGAAIHVIPETLAHTLSFGGVLFIVDGLHKCRHVQIEDWRTGLRSRTNPARVFSAALSRTRWCVGAGGAAPPSDSFVSIPMHGVISPLTAELRHRLPTELFSCGSRYPVTVFGGCPGFLAKFAVLTSLVRQSSPAALRVGSGETESAMVLDDPEIKALLDDLAAIHTPGFAHGSDCVVSSRH